MWRQLYGSSWRKWYPSKHNIMPHKQLNWYQNLQISMHAWKLDNLACVQLSYTADETKIVHQQLFAKPEWQYGSACEEHDFTETRTWFDWSKWTCPENCEQWCPEADLTTIDASFTDVDCVAWHLHCEAGRPKLQNHCHHEHYDKMSNIPKVDCSALNIHAGNCIEDHEIKATACEILKHCRYQIWLWFQSSCPRFRRFSCLRFLTNTIFWNGKNCMMPCKALQFTWHFANMAASMKVWKLSALMSLQEMKPCMSPVSNYMQPDVSRVNIEESKWMEDHDDLVWCIMLKRWCAQNWFWFRSSSPRTNDSACGTACRKLQEKHAAVQSIELVMTTCKQWCEQQFLPCSADPAKFVLWGRKCCRHSLWSQVLESS